MTRTDAPSETAQSGAGRTPATIGRVSVIIANYNYEGYVGAAIDSALGLDWPDVEVVVVDDGSTDGSRDVIRSYGDRVQWLFQDNATQRVARNRGFELATGDAVVHLDSDDVLRPQLMRRVASVWRPGVSKVQVQMEAIDAHGRPTGRRFPRWRRTPTPEDLRHWVMTTSAHPTPPGSGNVYAKEFLDRIFPLDDRCGPATDSACLIAAPLLGDVITLPEPLVGYRVHGANTSDMLARPEKFARAVERGRARFLYGRSLLSSAAPDESALRRSRELLQLRVAASRRTPREKPLPGDSRRHMLGDAIAALWVPGPENARDRVTITAWCLLTLLAPGPIADRLIRLRYSRA